MYSCLNMRGWSNDSDRMPVTASPMISTFVKFEDIVNEISHVSYTACSLDFEDGIGAWQKTGTAFDNQPTFGDNPTSRNREPAKQEGNWWIGGAEIRPSQDVPAGRHQGDAALGTLTSPCFAIVGNTISFLIGGGCNANSVRAELVVNNQVQNSLYDQADLMSYYLWYSSHSLDSG